MMRSQSAMRWWVFNEEQLDRALEAWQARIAQENGAAAGLASDLIKQFLTSNEAWEAGLIGGGVSSSSNSSNSTQLKGAMHEQV
ncbi:MAG: hypothetical protein AB1513_11975 [Pseudomonadota bacterium]